MLVRLPFAFFAGVVEVQHRGDGVDAQTVDVELLEPVQRVRDEEVAHLGVPEVEDQGAPVLLFAPAWIGVLVEGLPVESGERPVVLREVPRNPVDEHADAGLVSRSMR